MENERTRDERAGIRPVPYQVWRHAETGNLVEIVSYPDPESGTVFVRLELGRPWSATWVEVADLEPIADPEERIAAEAAARFEADRIEDNARREPEDGREPDLRRVIEARARIALEGEAGYAGDIERLLVVAERILSDLDEPRP